MSLQKLLSGKDYVLGLEEGPPEVPTSQWEEFSSKTEARGHSLVASGLFQCSGLWGFGPCSGDFWFVLS